MNLTDALKETYVNDMCIIKGRSPLTASSYWRSACLFFEFTAQQPCEPCSASVKQWLIHLRLHRNHKSNASRANRLAGLRSVCRWLVACQLLTSDPSHNVPSPHFRAQGMKKFSPSELSALFAAPDCTTAVGIRDRAILLLYYVTGMRRAEMCSVRLDQLQIGRRTGRVRIRGKGGKSRTVSFEGVHVVEVIMAWLAMRGDMAATSCHYLFCNMRGQAIGPGGMRLVLRHAAAIAGMDQSSVFLHKLRSTYATDLYDAKLDIKTIQLLMGHARVETTLEYIVISERHMQTARLPAAHTHALLR